MRFAPTREQLLFSRTLDDLLGAGAPGAAARAWSRGDRGPGERLWRGLAEAGLFGLAVPEEHGGVGLRPVELALGMVEAGRHAVPGPLVETAAAAVLLGGAGPVPGTGGAHPAARIADGGLAVSLAVPPWTPHALDADWAGAVIVLEGGAVHAAEPVEPLESLDPARKPWRVRAAAPLPGGPPGAPTGDAADAPHGGTAALAFDLAVLCCAAQALGAGERLLEATVEHVKTRHQFGQAVGGFQAVRHRLADTATALHFARPLVLGAAAAFGAGTEDPATALLRARDASAAKAAACDAAHTAARTALQLHGAIGYTDEFPPSLWIRKAHALRRAWGSPAAHRARVLEALDHAAAHR
ncbi:acyl-CoA/acyl-ACP dehydrogenase [Nocardiopsis sp. RSe5-2]|uniref:Acyl-CoA/acyl-ACP dehydrogenase n=1 Tax=Nocardiopsis endophytica TaxID=3018445 RepID=A0ABT4U7F9_9ACTN|nr:acyl-CoA dehydrogenase family protein [Nocardiopsis endophytica]MDA2812888.1 acyl-CoA/acyl-ACP dehydrogenase [Nocardiopsis endophytica]